MTPHEAAAYWFVRRDAGHFSDTDREQFDAWHSASELHARAYKQTSAMWRNFEESTDEGELRALQVAALAAAPAPRVWPRAAAIAAMFLGTFGLGALAWYSMSGHPARTVASTSTAEYVTTRSQRSTVTLPDGTLVSMNIDTQLVSDFSADKRRVLLSRGQAFFEVAKDARRPFTVAVADRNIRALGTKFDVRLDDARVEVVLLEGKVRVDRNLSLLEKLTTRPANVALAPGQRLVADIGTPGSVTATDAARATSWREGWIVFEDESLEQAIEELNRYSDKPIVAANEAVKHLRLSGVFRIGQPERFAAIIEELLPISVEQRASGETVLALRGANEGESRR